MKKETIEKLKKEYDILNIDGSQVTYLRANGSVGVMTINDEPSMAQDQFKDEVDVNNIMEKYIRAPNPAIFVRNGKGIYGDFTRAKDFQSSLDTILEAEDAFNSLDAKVRARFENDPGKLLKFLEDPKNLQEASNLGLVEIRQPDVNVKNDQTNNTNTNSQKNPNPQSSGGSNLPSEIT